MKLQFVKHIIILTAVFGITLGFIGCNQKGNATSQETGKVIKIKIGGMTCDSCAYSAKIALQKVNHVIKAEVSFDTKIGKVYVKKGKSVNVKDLFKAIEKIGYTAKLIN